MRTYEENHCEPWGEQGRQTLAWNKKKGIAAKQSKNLKINPMHKNHANEVSGLFLYPRPRTLDCKWVIFWQTKPHTQNNPQIPSMINTEAIALLPGYNML